MGAEDIHSMTQPSKKMSKLEKKVSNDKVCHSGGVYRQQLHPTNQSNDCDNSATAAPTSRSHNTTDTIDQHSTATGDNKSTVDVGREATTSSTSSSSSTTEIAHFAEQL